MEIHCISDTHNKHKEISLPGGDILIHSGDATGRGQSGEIEPFLKWYGSQDYTYKIFVAGNHDWGFEREPERYEKMCKKYGVTYLNDSGLTIQDFDTGEDIEIWGSPVQPEFCDWAFNRSIDKNPPLPDNFDLYHSYKPEFHPWIKPHWDKIPNDTDILITHGPPFGILDGVKNFYHDPHNMTSVGCPHLRDAIDRVKPVFHVFGHIHDQSGVMVSKGVTFCNAAQLNDSYNVHYKPKVFVWKNKQIKVKHP
jgi:predicted phosphodiesterase